MDSLISLVTFKGADLKNRVYIYQNRKNAIFVFDYKLVHALPQECIA